MESKNVSALQIINSLPFSRRQWLIVILCSLAVVFDGYEMQMISYVMPTLAKSWHITPVQAGLIASWGFAGMLVGSLSLGPIADYIGRKKALMIGLAIFSIFIGCASFSQGFVQISILRFLAGLGMGGVLPIAITIIAEFAPSQLRARTIAIVTGGFTLGFALAATLATLVIPVYGWKPMFYIGVLPILLIPILAMYLPESIRYLLRRNKREDAARILRMLETSSGIARSSWSTENLVVEEDQSKRSSLGELWSAKYRMITLRSTFMYAFLQIVVVAFGFWLPTLLVNRGFSLVQSYSYGIEQGLSATAGGLLLGWFVDQTTKKYGRKYSMSVIFILGAISLWLFGYANSITALYVFNGLAAMLVIGGQNIIHSMVTEVYPTRMRSTSVGWGLGVGRIGSVLGPTLGGYLITMNLPFHMYFVIYSLPLIIVALIILSFPKNADKMGEPVPTVQSSFPPNLPS